MSSANRHIEIEDVLRMARAFAAKHLSWFSPALYRCRIVITDKVPIAAIDKNYNTYWNPESIGELKDSESDRKKMLAQLAFIWVHEISHVLREHGERSLHVGANHKLWNVAADLEINDSNWKGLLPPVLFDILLPKTYQLPAGRTVEWYYKELSNNKNVCRSPSKCSCQSCSSNSSGGKSDNFEISEKESEKSNDGPKKEANNFEKWDDGSGAHGKIRPWEIADKDPQQITDMGRMVLNRDVARRMKVAGPPGKLPGGWNNWITHTLEPKVDWRNVLKNKLSTAITVGRGARIDYTFSRPNRRATLYKPFILPSLSGARSTQLTVVIDTSGSMNGGHLDQAVAELYQILNAAHQTVKLIPCDAVAYEPIDLRSPADIKRILELPGGGGTNMIRGIEYAAKQKPIPDTILVLTDGYTPYPAAKYKIPVLYGIIGRTKLSHSALPPNPPWGSDTCVFIDLEK